MVGEQIRKALALNDLGWMMVNRGQMDEARKSLEEARQILEQHGHRAGLARNYNFLGTLHYRQGQYRQAEKYYLLDMGISEQDGDLDAVCAILGNLGIVNYEQGHLEKAMEYYQQQILLSRKTGNLANICNGMGNLASIHMDRGEYEKAMECSLSQLEHATSMGEQTSIAVACNNIGDIQLKQGNFGPAMSNFQRQLSIAQKQGDKFLESVAWGDLGQAHDALQQDREALDEYGKAIRIQAELDIKYYLCYYLSCRAYILFRSGCERESATDNEKALSTASDIGREEVAFRCRVLQALLKQKEDRNGAAYLLLDLLSEQQDGRRRFELFCWLFQMTLNPDYKRQAGDIAAISETGCWPHSLRLLAEKLKVASL
jgi:tetratricopeptide (TPR) repeat protein